MGRILSLEQARETEGQERDWVYNCADVTGTLEIGHVLLEKLDPVASRTYAFERSLLAPAFAMTRRGILVDEIARAKARKQLEKERDEAIKRVNAHPILLEKWDQVTQNKTMCKKSTRKDGRHTWPVGVPDEVRTCKSCGAPRLIRADFNPMSAPQCIHLFIDLLKVKPILNKKGSVGMDEETLAKIKERYPKFAEIADAILAVRDCVKQLGFLSAKLSPAGRFHASFSPGAAWTGRWASSQDPFNRGGNCQNISERHRHIFIADPGYKLFYADLERAESCMVAYLSGDEAYIEAHKGDTHTLVCKILWPELDWTGDPKKDKALAKGSNPEWDQLPGHDWRFQAKRIQHGSNYGLSPRGISMIAHIPLKEAERAYEAYFAAFPRIKAWHKYIKERVESQLPLYNALGRRCTLFGRPWDGHTFKQGLSFGPQSGVADILDIGLWRIWHFLDPHMVMLLAQVHDAVMGQWLVEKEEEAARAVVECMSLNTEVVDIYGVSRIMRIPVEISSGKNWGKYDPDTNPDGQREIKL